MCGMYLSLYKLIIGNYVHDTFISFGGKHDNILQIMSCLLSEHVLWKESTVKL